MARAERGTRGLRVLACVLAWLAGVTASPAQDTAAGPGLARRVGSEVQQTFSDSVRDTPSVAETLRVGPAAVTQRNRTSFDGALRCMDRLFASYGIRDVAMILEHIPDATGKVNAGAREMFMSATSRMTLRSHAIRLVPVSGSVLFLERRDFIGQGSFALQGAISQLDDSIVKRQRDGSICIGPFCVGLASSDSYSALGLDLNVIRASDLGLVPGVSSKNAVLVARHGAGSDGEFSTGKFGVNFNFSFSTSEGNGQALRTMIELGAIELYGRLVRVPYWSCLGADTDQPEVAAEIDDWWESFAADQSELWRWLQIQMGVRGLYQGPIDGVANQALADAVGRYQQALGLQAGAPLDANFLRAYLAADHAQLKLSATTSRNRLARQTTPDLDALLGFPSARPPAPAPAPKPPAGRRNGTPAATGGDVEVRELHRPANRPHRRGEAYAVAVKAPDDGYLYCWLIDDRQHLHQFFPNPAQPSARVQGSRLHEFPGTSGFALRASQHGERESVVCGWSAKDLGYRPLGKRETAVRNAESLRIAFEQAAGRPTPLGVFHVDSR